MPITVHTDSAFCFGIFPDNFGRPVAVFQDLEDAINWGVRRYGSGAFGIRRVDLPAMISPAPAESSSQGH